MCIGKGTVGMKWWFKKRKVEEKRRTEEGGIWKFRGGEEIAENRNKELKSKEEKIQETQTLKLAKKQDQTANKQGMRLN